MTITDGGAKQPGDIGRVRRAGCVQVVVQVIAGAVEKQADVQGLATRRQDPATRRQAQGILIVSLSLAMAMDILLDLTGLANDLAAETAVDTRHWHVLFRA
ncbi:hypothetical protein [Pseudomonas syringae]|uniref:hypothetical protein n=1 Tax=Pseudomonas syringae TaxID=317 RepID=UPI001E362925|nr:hypothetical protein [Pseudomonas syringae]